MVTRVIVVRNSHRVTATIISEGFQDFLEFMQTEFAGCKLLSMLPVREGEDR
ncbi:MAG: hypothetical protein V3S83_12400 [Gemmatimonadota bacterium]